MQSNIPRLGDLIQQNTLAPCAVATTTNINLSGLQTVDGVSLSDGVRVLVKDQDNLAENGIYICRSIQWERSTDWNERSDIISGTVVVVTGGTDGEDVYQGIFINPISVGSTSVTFTPLTAQDELSFSDGLINSRNLISVTSNAGDNGVSEKAFSSDILFISMTAAGLLQNGIVSDTAPASPAQGDYWLNTSNGNEVASVWNTYDGVAFVSTAPFGAPEVDFTSVASLSAINAIVQSNIRVSADGTTLEIADGVNPVTGLPTFTPCPTFTSYAVTDATDIDITYTISGAQYLVDWGDGSAIETVTSGDTVTHTYAAPFTGDVRLGRSSTDTATGWVSTQGAWTFPLSALDRTLTTYDNISPDNATFGPMIDMPRGLIIYRNLGINLTDGPIADTARTLTSFSNQGASNNDGNIGDFGPDMQFINIQGVNSVSGPIQDIGAATVQARVYGNNTISGNSDLITAPSLRIYDITGNNTVVSTMQGIPASVEIFRSAGNGVVSSDGTPVSITRISDIRVIGTPLATGADVDAILASLINVTAFTGTKAIELRGGNPSPTAAGLAHRDTILANGASAVNVN